MVEVTKLRELQKISDLKERNDKIRKLFAAYSPSLDVTGNESEALTILVNLTFKRDYIEDLCDLEFAKATLKNTEHIENCIKEVKWLHTHNLKYPDIRVSKQRLISKPLTLIPNTFSSANLAQMFGWSHDSKSINLSKIFVCHFMWHGELTCLAALMKDESEVWAKTFKNLGVTLKQYRALCNKVKTGLPSIVLPSSVDNYSIQIQFPYRDGYLAITPVVSHVIQSKIQQILRQKRRQYTNIVHTRPSSVSELVSSLGGNISVLNYPPRISSQIKSLGNLKKEKLARGENIYYHKVLSSNFFTRALDDLIYSDREITHKKRRRSKLSSYKRIRTGLIQWLRPIIDWRTELDVNKEDIEQLETLSPIVHSLLTFQNQLSERCHSTLFTTLNNHLPSKYAFHPDIILSLQGLLIGVVNKIGNLSHFAGETTGEQNGQNYLCLKDIQASDVQALSNPYCLGIPSLTAIYGMIHNYQRRINEYLKTGIQFGSFAWYLRSYSAVNGVPLPEYTVQNSGTRSYKLRRPGLIDTRLCDLSFDLVITVYGDEDDVRSLIDNQDKLMAAFPSKFAGGTMLPNIVANRDSWCQLIQNKYYLHEELKRLPSFGQWVLPVSQNLSDISELMNTLEDDKRIAPVNTGFSFLEEPRERKCSIERLHCYAEPLIGLVRFTDALDIKLSGINRFINQAFWKLESQHQYINIKRAN